MESKADGANYEHEDEMEAFDNLEKNFHKVIQDLITDHSLDRFREEYERLHAELVKSHENNQELINRCRDMKNSILANANKVSSVLTLSQNDQRTIAGLRHEFEKAWKMVEVSQDREVKSRETIEVLKDEVQHLSRLVEQGGAMAMTQGTSMQEMKEVIADLNKDIETQNEQLENLRKQREDSKTLMETLVNRIADLKSESVKLDEELQQAKTASAGLRSEIDGAAKEISGVKANMKSMGTQFEDGEVKIQQGKDKIKELENELREDRRDIKSAEDDLRANRDHIKSIKKTLKERAEATKKSRADLGRYGEMVEEQEKVYAKYVEQLKQVADEKVLKDFELGEYRKWRKDLDVEKAESKKQVIKSVQEKTKLAADETRKRVTIQTMRTVIDRDTKEQRNLKARTSNEKADTKAVEDQSKILTSEIVAIKGDTHEARSKVSRVKAETSSYESKIMLAKNSESQIKEDIKAMGTMIDEGRKKVDNLYERQRRQMGLIESLQNERDLTSRMVQSSNKENEALRGENEAIAKEIAVLKEDIRKKDEECVATHFRQKQISQQIRTLTSDVKEMQRRIKEADDFVTETRNKISRARYLISEAELDQKQQKNVLNDITMSARLVEKASVKKGDERTELQNKVKVLTSMIQKGRASFEKQEDDIEESERILSEELDRQKYLMETTRHARALRLECLRIEKSIVQEMGKERALEEEMQKPMNVHRWRFLDSTNPELAQLIRMNMSLRDRLMTLIYRLDKLNRAKKVIAEKAAREEKHLQNSYGGHLEEEKAYLHDLLKQKNRLLKQMQQQADAQGTTVMGTRDQLMNVRTMVREEKSELYGQKKRVERMRAQTAYGTRPQKRPVGTPITPRPETRFVGGGFAVGGVLTPRKMENPSPANPEKFAQLVLPVKSPRRMRQTPQPRKITPRGWNPRREPISPYIKTASDF